MKWEICKTKHKEVAEELFSALADAGIRVDSEGPRHYNEYYEVSYMPIGSRQRETAYAIIDSVFWKDIY